MGDFQVATDGGIWVAAGERQKLTQEKAADFFDVPRPKISQIQNNKLQGISIEYLVRMLAKTGGKLTYSFRQPSKQTAKARLRVHNDTATA